MTLSKEELERRFTYHAPDLTTRGIHDEWRNHEMWYAEHLNEFDDSRELSLAFTKLEEMTFWVHAHIARNITKE